MHKVRKAMQNSKQYPLSKLVHASAKIVTDQWKGYTPLTKIYDIEQIPSKKGKNFKQLHIIVHLVKS